MLDKRVWTSENIDFLVKNYGKLATKDISKIVDHPVDSIWKKAQSLNLSYWENAERVNHNFLDKLNPDNSWWLGVFASDGNATIRSKKAATIQFGMNDVDCIEKLHRICSCKNKITKYDGGSYHMYFSSHKVYDKLCSIFRHPVIRKSKNLLFPSIPDKLLRHFIRGVIDGDGCVRFYSRNTPFICIYSGSKRFIDGVYEKVREETGIVLNRNKSSTVYVTYCSGIKAKCLAKWAYGDCAFYLERKKKKADEFASWKPKFIRKSSLTLKMCSVFNLEWKG